VRCAEVKEMLPSLVDGDDSLSLRRHLSHCPECRAELVQYEALHASTLALAAVTSEPPPGLLRSLQAIPASGGRVAEVRTHIARNRRAYAGGAAAVLGAGVAGAVLWRTHSRRLATA
jgi:anti-sigma factor RsiW